MLTGMVALLLSVLVYFQYLSFCSLCHFNNADKRSKGVFHLITKTHGTIICVSTGIVLLLLFISVLVQVKQPRKKVPKTNYNPIILTPPNLDVELWCINCSLIFFLQVLVHKNQLFHRDDSQEVCDPPQYELFALRAKVSLISFICCYLKHAFIYAICKNLICKLIRAVKR